LKGGNDKLPEIPPNICIFTKEQLRSFGCSSRHWLV